MTIDEALRNRNVLAFLRAIRLGEGTLDADGYRRIVGGDLFDSFADHPRKRVWIERYQVWSTAAGAYQFIANTWDEMRAKYGLRDFSPGEQDKGAIGLLIRRKALDDVIAGRIEAAIAKCRLEWASLPGSPYGQRTESMQRVLDTYVASGGEFAPTPAEAATELVADVPPIPQQIAASPQSISVEAEPMDPFTATALSALVREIPNLIRSFGSEGRVTERNAKAAELLIGSVQAATGTPNAQAAVEAIRSSPEVRDQVTRHLEAEGWFEVTEAGGGGIEGARAYSTTMKGEDVRHIPAFWITLALLPLLYGTVWIVLTGSSEAFSGELRAAIASSVVTGVLGGVIGYWLGLKFSAPRAQVLTTGQQP